MTAPVMVDQRLEHLGVRAKLNPLVQRGQTPRVPRGLGGAFRRQSAPLSSRSFRNSPSHSFRSVQRGAQALLSDRPRDFLEGLRGLYGREAQGTAEQPALATPV